MPGVEHLRVIFERVYVRNDADWWGSGEFYFTARVDDVSLDRHEEVHEAIEGHWIKRDPFED